jgi:hypothetical protein
MFDAVLKVAVDDPEGLTELVGGRRVVDRQ